MTPIWQDPRIIAWTQCLLDSYEQYLQRSLISRKDSQEEQAKFLFFAPFSLVSHDNQKDPLLNYGNQTALNLWEMTWEQFTQTPSRLTAESLNQQGRAKILSQVSDQGFIENYQGIRISRTGKRFLVKNVTIWNLVAQQGVRCGQAAIFHDWQYL